MRLAFNDRSIDDVRVDIKNRFANLNRQCTPSKGRKYPEELRDLVRQGAQVGIGPRELRRLSGMSESAVRYALSQKRLPEAVVKLPPPRRLEVVDSSASPPRAGSIAVRLPSGVTIELSHSAALTPALLAALAHLEVSNVASR